MATSPQFSATGAGSQIRKGKADEAHLMERISEGDEPSLVLIYDRYSPLAFTLALHVLRDPSAAEDIVQEVFLKLWREPKAYDHSRGSLSAWIAISARHRAVDYWRKNRHETQMPDGLEVADSRRSPEGYFADMDKVWTCLSASQRDILEISYFGGLSHSQIASQTGLPLGTVKTKIRQALASVRRQLLPAMKSKPPSKERGL